MKKTASTRSRQELLALKFQKLDLHDDVLERIEFIPPISRRSTARIRITLLRHWKDLRRVLEFSGCANHEVTMDSDILKGNLPWNTSRVSAKTDGEAIANFIRRHKRTWDVTYEKDPIAQKVAGASSYVLFRVQFFGGRLDVAARSFRLSSPKELQP